MRLPAKGQFNISFRASQLTFLTKLMTQSLTPAAAAAAVATITPPSHKISATHRNISVFRRDVLVGTVFGLTINVGDKSTDAAARRPPPPPPTEKEKNDPNVSGVLAKVLASKKRKEAMKQSIAKLREKGKPVNEPSPVPAPRPAE